MGLELCVPARRLGVTREASFEEVQDARNFLYEVRRYTRALHLCFLASSTSFEVLLRESVKARDSSEL